MGTSTEGLTTTPRDIEATRAELTRDIDELTDKVSPQRVIERRKEAVRGRFGSVREKVMGAASSTGGTGGTDVAGSVKDKTQSAADSVGSYAQGSPLVAGAVAFGVGLLVAGALPASDAEARAAQQLAETGKEKAAPLVDEAKSVAAEMGQDLKESAQQSAQEVKATAQDSAQTLKQEGQSSASNVKDQAKS